LHKKFYIGSNQMILHLVSTIRP